MAPPLPPPGVPLRAGLAPLPMAWLRVNRLFRMVQDTPMLLSAPPLEHTPPSKVLPTMYTGRSFDWSKTRTAAPPRSGPVDSHLLLTNLEFTTLNRPPRTKIAPPPPPPSYSVRAPFEFPSAKIRFCRVSWGWSWSVQWEVVWPWAASQ